MQRTKFASILLAAVVALGVHGVAAAHHGKDFLLVETDDRPQQGHIYAVASFDTVIESDGAKRDEYTPGLLFSVGDKLTVEPHVHYARAAGAGLHYDAAALGLRYAVGYIGRSDWRFAVSAEAEKPGDNAEPNNGAARLIFARTYPSMLVAANITVGRTFDSIGAQTYGLLLGALKPLTSSSSAGIEVSASIPFSDGVEIVPGLYHKIDDITTAKVGIGYYTSRTTKSGTLHVQLIRRF